METTMRLRRARFIAVLLSTALVVGLLHGVLLVTLGRPDALLTWWGTGLRAVLAVLICLGIAGAVDRRWSAWSARSARSARASST